MLSGRHSIDIKYKHHVRSNDTDENQDGAMDTHNILVCSHDRLRQENHILERLQHFVLSLLVPDDVPERKLTRATTVSILARILLQWLACIPNDHPHSPPHSTSAPAPSYPSRNPNWRQDLPRSYRHAQEPSHEHEYESHHPLHALEHFLCHQNHYRMWCHGLIYIYI